MRVGEADRILMATPDFSDRLRRYLPGGEWTDLVIIDSAGGMMEGLGTVHATATYVRDGGRPAYIKCIRQRGESAGVETKVIAGPKRLERLAERIGDLKATKAMPVAEVLSVDLAQDLPALVVAMERVVPLVTMIQEGAVSRETAVQLLRALASSQCKDWIHFDICPKNVGVSATRGVVFIDLDSLYPVGANINISVPAFKPHRASPAVYAKCVDVAIGNGNYDRSFLSQKHDAELLLLAAECCLGLYAEDSLTEESVDEWVDSSHASDAEKEFWRKELKTLANGTKPDPIATAKRLEALKLDAAIVQP